MEQIGANSRYLDKYQVFVGKPSCDIVLNDFISDKHLHREVELVVVKEGVLQVQIEDKLQEITKGQLLVIAKNVLHQYIPTKQRVILIKIKFMEEWLDAPFLEIEEKEQIRELYSHVQVIQLDSNLEQVLDEMQNANSSRFWDWFCFSKIIEFTIGVFDNPKSIKQIIPVEFRNYQYIEEAMDYMEKHCTEQISLGMLADHLGISESYCSRYIKKCTGMSFSRYVNAIRVSNAQRLLAYTDLDMMRISEKSGFLSIQTFNRVFHDMIGRTPTEYRKMKSNQLANSRHLVSNNLFS